MDSANDVESWDDEDWEYQTVDYDSEKRLSICDQSSLVCNLLFDNHEGKSVDLHPIKQKYSEIHRDGRSFIWNLDQMSSDFGDSLDGRRFDGLTQKGVNRDTIGMIILKALIAQGADPKTLTSHGRTALQIAALAGDIEYCKKLVKMGVDVSQTNEVGETALMLSNRWNNKPRDLSRIIRYLKKFE